MVLYRIGDVGLKADYYHVLQGGELILLPTAKEIWDSTINKVNVLIDGCKLKDILFESTTVQQCLVMLVTGLEVYTKNRFLEMEKEGKKPNIEALMNEFAINNSLKNEVENYSSSNKVSLLESLVQVRKYGIINFQDWDTSKKAYNKGYNIRSGEIPKLKTETLESIKKYIFWRHKIIHSKIDMSTLNSEELPYKDPIFATKGFIETARNNFIDFVEKLHLQTL